MHLTGFRRARRGPVMRAGAALGAALLGAVMIAVPAVMGPQGVAVADSVSDRKARLDRELAELRDALEGTSADLVEAAVALRRVQADLADARGRLTTARNALAEAERRDAELAARLAVARADEAKAVRDLAQRRAQEQRTRQRVGRIAREAYLSRGLGQLAVALSAESPGQFADRVTAVGTALRAQNGALERLDVVQAETRARQAKLTAARAQVDALKKESAVLVEARRAAERTAAAAEAEVAGVVAKQQQVVAVIESKKAAEQARIAAMEREQAKLRRLLAERARGGGGGGGGDGGSSLSQPVNAPVTSQFGRRYHPVLKYWRLHAGTDFGAPCGTPVRAAASGTVVRASWAGGYGNQIVVDHGRMRGSHLATSYNHLSRFVVRGGSVRRGQVIGYSGTTGLSTGCHLHFEVYQGGNHVNPMNWL